MSPDDPRQLLALIEQGFPLRSCAACDELLTVLRCPCGGYSVAVEADELRFDLELEEARRPAVGC